MTPWLLMAGGVAALACGLYRSARQQVGRTPAKKKTTTFAMRCKSCRRVLLVDTNRHFADPNDSESFAAQVTCPHCRRDHDVAYSPAGAIHKVALVVPPEPEPPKTLPVWKAKFSAN